MPFVTFILILSLLDLIYIHYQCKSLHRQYILYC